jgi:N-acyl-D-amino-acid deacylase
MLDVAIVGGRVVDGTGSPPFAADIGIVNGRIVTIGHVDAEEASRRLDASGLVVAPGFIDVHSHRDFELPNEATRQSEVTLTQGVTTEVIGLCGQTAAPVPPQAADAIHNYMKYFVPPEGLDWDWSTVGEYLEKIEKGGISENVAMLVGHTNLRLAVMGYESRPATSREVEAMKNLLTQAMEEGAFGLSTGLQWSPAFFSETSELIQLNHVVARSGGIYASHMRSEGDKLLAAIEEVVEIGWRTGVTCHVSHLKAAGRQNWGKMEPALQLIEDARSHGIDIAPDKQPYTVENMALRACLPPWVVSQAGGVEGLTRYLKNPRAQRELMRELREMNGAEWDRYIVDNIWQSVGWDNLIIDGCACHPEYRNRSLSSLGKQLGVPPEEIFFDLLADAESATTAFYRYEAENEVQRTLRYPHTIPASDRVGHGHPRNYGAFPRWLGSYVRDLGLVTLAEGVRKITSLPAQRCGIPERGMIREGYWADITVFDENAIAEGATFEEPAQVATGIHHVLVNGVAVISDGHHLGSRPGQVLRRQ